jgi:anti-anti-sigma factor
VPHPVTGFQIGTIEASGDVRILPVSGDFDLAAVPEVESALALLEIEAPAVLAIDLRELELIDSSALRTILNAVNRAHADGRRFVVIAPPTGPVGRLLELTLVGDHVEVVDDPSALSPSS